MKFRMSAPLCRYCDFKLHVPFTCGFCTRRSLTNPWPDRDDVILHPRCTDERSPDGSCGPRAWKFRYTRKEVTA
jgi:hypothetical protein